MKRILTSILLLAALFLAACNASQTSPTGPQDTPTPEASATPSPSPTPTLAPARALFSGDPSDPALNESALALLNELAGPAGLSVEAVEGLQADLLAPEVRLVVALTPPADLGNLLAAAPQAQFVVASAAPLEPAANLSVLQLQPERQAFMAGFIAVLLSDDWRAAGLIPSDSPALQDAFTNGGGYYCGECSPGWPLGTTFPLVGGASAGAGGPAWQTVTADFFDNGKAEVFYVSPEAARAEVFAYLTGLSQFETPVRLVGAQPPPDGLAAQWAATVGFDLLTALREALPTALAGQSAGSLSVPVSLSNVNPNLLTPGRQEMVAQIQAEVTSGMISPLSVPIDQ